MSKETEPLIINTPEDGFLRIGNTTCLLYTSDAADE